MSAKWAMKAAVDRVLSSFRDYLIGDYGYSPNEIPTILSGGASLPTGGLFDIRSNWKAPHCGHRNGENLDLSHRRLSFREQLALKLAIKDVKKLGFYAGESPATPKATHWHLYYRGGVN
jgi:hypothetical protein